MARKFDVGRATEEELRERVRTLTSALIKQKEQIERIRTSEHALAGEKEKLERQVINFKEEAEMSRQMRSELQGEVARMQRALELRAAEAEMIKTEAQKYIFGSDSSQNSDEELKTAREELEDAKTQLFLSSGGFDPAHSPDGQQDHETDEGLLPAKVEALGLAVAMVKRLAQEGEASAVDQPEGSNSDVTGSEDGENAVMRWKTRCLRLERLYQDTRDRLEKASAERQKLEEERALVDSRYDKLHVTYQQANKYIQELEDARRNKDKEFEGLREQLEKYSAANGINTAKKNEEVMTLQAKINSLQDEIASLNSEKSKLESTIQSITNTLQACKRVLLVMVKHNPPHIPIRISRKEIESLKNSLESTAGKLNALQASESFDNLPTVHTARQEEHDKQLAMDKEIVKGLQNDARVKLAEVENALQSSKLTVMVLTMFVMEDEEMIEIRLSNHHIENGKETSDDGLKEFIHRERERSTGAMFELTCLSVEQEELVQQALASIEELLETLGSDNTA
ncbi:hypothetical protein GUITHDRAFT_132960 [Guillardia theta CCMP2712]|uniref:Uncharacterized protein n=1 Tax=Guillardia theta (strain CCMP2712) TaxID=905079 RepID=L1JYA0_GUITC|nr:hypothetical protein GUITHDRAFT_132960 [Guillardia theta CCMP2712]EKX53200.1 hypothetical protein GUITHDRAFT_132960 [Guillardia theta CCMP2712]|eukprot:XP_005840180.1 hypothetical protein GUITHDRAFT_132960 [Guillardia theta CCMP2712]